MSEASLSVELVARFETAEEGALATVGEVTFLPLAELDSGGRLGLDVEGRWVLAPVDGAAVVFGPGQEGALAEVVETNRRALDDRLEAGAATWGLPVDPVLVSFPAVELVRGLLTRRSGYVWRLAIAFLLPSEVGELREDIAKVAGEPDAPQAVRDLARRLLGTR